MLFIDRLHVEAVLAVSKDLPVVLDAQYLLPNPVVQDVAKDATKWACFEVFSQWFVAYFSDRHFGP